MVNAIPITSQNKYFQIRTLLLFHILTKKLEESDVTFPTITNQLMSHLYGQNQEMKRFSLNFLIYLNHVQYKEVGKHVLCQTDDLQIPPEIVMVVNTFDNVIITKILRDIHPHLNYYLKEKLKIMHEIPIEIQTLIFVLVNNYPCVLKNLNPRKEETLDFLVNLCDCDNEELISAIITSISTFLLHFDCSFLEYDKLIRLLQESASPAAKECRRFATSEFLAKNYIFYGGYDAILKGDELQMVLCIIMVLLEDDNLAIRNSMSMFATSVKIKITLNNNPNQVLSSQRCLVIPEKAREYLLELASIVLPKDRAICFLFSWACRHFSDASVDSGSAVFERGEINLYAENISFAEIIGGLLHKFLWTLEEGLSYEDKSIFIEEQTLLVTTRLLDSMVKYPSPMMLSKTKLSVICALKSIVKFLERYEINVNFVKEFKKYLNETIIGHYLTKQLEHGDFHIVRWIFKDVYAPVFEHSQ